MKLFFDFTFFLTALMLVTGIGYFADVTVLAKRRLQSGAEQSKFIEYCRALFPAIFLVWAVRSFAFDHFRVPTGSLEPTIMPGDFIAIKPYEYGLRVPVLRKKVVSINEPKLGDIALFYWPKDESVRFVKRIVGLPGDHIQYKNKTLFVNGKKAEQKYIGEAMSEEPGRAPSPVAVFEENLQGVKHFIYVRKDLRDKKEVDVIVPADHYFAMGDNRDDSYDSRYWGAVSEKNFIGQAFGVWMSWNSNLSKIRWDRIGKGIS